MDHAFSRALLEWYEASRRILPWREDPTPYHVFLSEMMLQQTRVDTVKAYYLRFLDAYPDFASLAKAEEEDVLRLWQGLGYYSRARNLLSAAKKVVADYGGDLPFEEKVLRRLPGVGEYMASAIAGIAFDLPSVAVDGNLLRVYARLEGKKIDVSSSSAKRECAEFYRSRLESPSRFNQALMDLGELVCLPHGAPQCDRCPFANRCKAHKKGDPEEYPLPKKKAAVQQVRLAVVLLCRGKKVAIQKRPEQGLLAGLYEFPNFDGEYDEAGLKQRCPSLTLVKKESTVKHRFSHVEWTMDVFAAEGSLPGASFVDRNDLGSVYSLPTAFAKLLPLLPGEEAVV